MFLISQGAGKQVSQEKKARAKGVEFRRLSTILHIASKREVSDIDGDGVHGQEG
jgi:hypothetical protein